jgi:glycosyltransferase involved in cell wall biosynthesis
MPLLTLIRTSPPGIPGSMPAYGDLVWQAAGPFAEGWEMAPCDLFDPAGGTSMWKHHLWRLRNAKRVLGDHPADLYHWLDGSMAAFIPRALRGRSLVTVHDLIPLLQLRGELPGRPSLPAAWLIRRGVEALRGCAALCADSFATRTDLMRWGAIAAGVEVIPVPLRQLPSPESGFGSEQPARFILHVGNNAAYKNRRGVLEIFSRLRDCADLHLVLAGPPPTPELRTVAAGLSRVHFVGPVDDAQLNGLYQRAAVFLFPSFYEGYGMPVLEAMAAGCPVVCSAAAALAEVAGDAALFAPAEDCGALAAHCRTVLADPSLRKELVARGRARAALFDVASMGRSLMKWYEMALNAQEKREPHA